MSRNKSTNNPSEELVTSTTNEEQPEATAPSVPAPSSDNPSDKPTRKRKERNLYRLLYQPSEASQLIVFFMHNNELTELAIYSKETGQLTPFNGGPAMQKGFQAMVTSRKSEAIEIATCEVNIELQGKLDVHLVSFFSAFGSFIRANEQYTVIVEDNKPVTDASQSS